MTNEEATKHLTAKLECLTRSKGCREKCDSYNSYEGYYECDLGYKQGNIGEQIESLKLAIKALEQEDILDKIRAEILEEKECAYADFERYKVEYLGQDWEDALDSLPQDDFRYGMERVIEIIDKYKAESEG